MPGPKRAFLLAHPAGHSLSPRMHSAAFAAVGLDATYRALDVAPADLGATVARLVADHDFLGANVTTPHKVAVVQVVDFLSSAAAAVGAVNTLVRAEDALLGDNTDVAGFLAAIVEAFGRVPARATVLGSGGAAAAAVFALVSRGAEVAVAARRPEAAAAMLERMGPAVGTRAVAVGPSDVAGSLGRAELIVNATTAGMVGGPAPSSLPLDLDPAAIAEGAFVFDMVYNPRETPLVLAARERGLQASDGLEMLVQQGAAAFSAWTGLEAPVAAMRSALGA